MNELLVYGFTASGDPSMPGSLPALTGTESGITFLRVGAAFGAEAFNVTQSDARFEDFVRATAIEAAEVD